MEQLLKIYNELTIEDKKNLYENGIIVLDNNILRDIFRVPPKVREDWLKAFKDSRTKSRFWIPFQVFFEFISTESSEILKYDKDQFTNLQNTFEGLIKKLQDLPRNLKTNGRHGLIDRKEINLKDAFANSLIEYLNKEKNMFNETEHVFTLEKIKPIRDEILDIFKENIGNCLSKQEIDDIIKDGERRYKLNIPPGYEDKDKEGSRIYENLQIPKKYGDLIIWKEIIKYAKDNEIEYLLFVTNEVKEDWILKNKRKNIEGPRLELKNEIYYEAPRLKVFDIVQGNRFLDNINKYYPDLEINQESIDFQYNDQPQSLDLIQLEDLIKNILIEFEGSNFDFKNLWQVKLYPLNRIIIQDLIRNIFLYVSSQSNNNRIDVCILEADQQVILRFHGYSLAENFKDMKHLEGLLNIKFNLQYFENDQRYIFDCIIPRNLFLNETELKDYLSLNL